MLAIDRVRSLKPRFVVRDDGGERGAWVKEKLFKSTLAGDLDDVSYLVICELPTTLPTTVQAFVALLALTIWNSGGAELGLAAGLGQIES